MSIGQRAVAVLCDWEGNRPGVAPPMHHKVCGISTYKLSGDEHHSYTPVRSIAPFATYL